MTIEQYIEALGKIKDQALGRWDNMQGIDKEAFNGAYDWLTGNLRITNGVFQSDDQLSRDMDRFVSAVVSIVNNNQTYQGKISSFLIDLSKIQQYNKEFHATEHNFNIETAGVTEAQRTVVNEIINQYTGNGLNAHFATPLRDGVYRNILAGADLNDVKQTLRDYIVSGKDGSGKLQQYLTQTAQQAVDSYSGAINQKLQEEFKFTGMIISGSLIETSSLQCRYAIDNSKDGYLPYSEWKVVLGIAAANKRALLIPGTTVENLPLNKLHWGCRHEFTPVIV